MNRQELYEYLTKNSCAHFYANYIDQIDDQYRTRILENGNKLNKKYEKTLKLILDISESNKMTPILFKTYKHIPEIVDNDIDLIINPDHIGKLIKLLNNHGYFCLEESRGKFVCNKEGFNKIEPRIDISIDDYIILTFNEVQKYIMKTNFKNRLVISTNQEIDSLYFILNFLYGPNYLKLYRYFLIDGVGLAKIKHIAREIGVLNEVIFFEKEVISKILNNVSYPLFLGNFAYLRFYFKFLFFNKKIYLTSKIKHPLFFFFFKYKYIIFNKLHFQKP